LYRAVKYPNTQLFSEPPAITGNQAADARIRTLAESKGYQLTSIPVTVIVKVVGKQLEGDDLLQPLAAKDWNDLYSAAAKEGVALALMSAYRSPEYQRNLFMQRLTANGGNVERIAAGQGDAAVVQTLGMTAVPGYSRHHTGYTVDFWCDDGSGTFMASSCFEWLSDNNYQHAKEHGWIPSYPSGASEQGPEPEAWEYVWVGQDFLRD
jgi:D-alanyl-D-alanine carboxypeptidase